jgi:hypothetical protein
MIWQLLDADGFWVFAGVVMVVLVGSDRLLARSLS